MRGTPKLGNPESTGAVTKTPKTPKTAAAAVDKTLAAPKPSVEMLAGHLELGRLEDAKDTVTKLFDTGVYKTRSALETALRDKAGPFSKLLADKLKQEQNATSRTYRWIGSKLPLMGEGPKDHANVVNKMIDALAPDIQADQQKQLRLKAAQAKFGGETEQPTTPRKFGGEFDDLFAGFVEEAAGNPGKKI